MIVVETGRQLHLVTQCDHAHLAAEILALVPSLRNEPLRRTLLRATRRHDDGWQGVDAAPPVDDDGRPHDFMNLPWDLRTEVWNRGTSLPGLDAEAALLIAEHAAHLHREHAESGEGRFLVELVEERLVALRADVGPAASEELSALYPWLRTMDLVSLIAVNRWTDHPFDFELPGVGSAGRASLEPGTTTLRLDPFPLAGTTTLHYSERRIDHRPYRDAVDLGVELASAKWVSADVTLKSWG